MPSTYTPIASTTISGSSTSSITFNSFSGYTDLRMVFDGQSVSGNPVIALRLNGSAGAYYSRTFMGGNGTSAFSSRDSNVSLLATIRLKQSQTNVTWDIMNYSNTTTFKTILSQGSDASTERIQQVFLFRGTTGSSTAAITSLEVLVDSSAFAAGSTLTLYGIQAA